MPEAVNGSVMVDAGVMQGLCASRPGGSTIICFQNVLRYVLMSSSSALVNLDAAMFVASHQLLCCVNTFTADPVKALHFAILV